MEHMKYPPTVIGRSAGGAVPARRSKLFLRETFSATEPAAVLLAKPVRLFAHDWLNMRPSTDFGSRSVSIMTLALSQGYTLRDGIHPTTAFDSKGQRVTVPESDTWLSLIPRLCTWVGKSTPTWQPRILVRWKGFFTSLQRVQAKTQAGWKNSNAELEWLTIPYQFEVQARRAINCLARQPADMSFSRSEEFAQLAQVWFPRNHAGKGIRKNGGLY